jgi:hypothetical protein
LEVAGYYKNQKDSPFSSTFFTSVYSAPAEKEAKKKLAWGPV